MNVRECDKCGGNGEECIGALKKSSQMWLLFSVIGIR